jgi:DNA-binding XRE family transcriptional regulator
MGKKFTPLYIKRLQMELSLQQLSELITLDESFPRIKISSQGLSKIERGAVPRLDTAIKICKVMDMPIEDLLIDKDIIEH